jgi:hypothetical protein
MRPAGLKAFAARLENKSRIYSYEQRKAQLEEPYANLLKNSKPAWNCFYSSRRRTGKWLAGGLSAQRKKKREWLAWQN